MSLFARNYCRVNVYPKKFVNILFIYFELFMMEFVKMSQLLYFDKASMIKSRDENV